MKLSPVLRPCSLVLWEVHRPGQCSPQALTLTVADRRNPGAASFQGSPTAAERVSGNTIITDVFITDVFITDVFFTDVFTTDVFFTDVFITDVFITDAEPFAEDEHDLTGL
uniref:Uncharacterized protein n=1 Tax=Knipowitschia caucasica TaxID=637954 RepID=A0AAV2JBU5_KNICA